MPMLAAARFITVSWPMLPWLAELFKQAHCDAAVLELPGVQALLFDIQAVAVWSAWLKVVVVVVGAASSSAGVSNRSNVGSVSARGFEPRSERDSWSSVLVEPLLKVRDTLVLQAAVKKIEMMTKAENLLYFTIASKSPIPSVLDGVKLQWGGQPEFSLNTR